MKVTIIYRPDSEHSRKVEEFVHELERQHNIKIELISLNTRDGPAWASMYDVTSYPAVIVVREDGQVMNVWQGNELPLMNEVAAYVNA